MINASSPVDAVPEQGLAGSVGMHILWCDLLRQVGWEMEDNLEAAMRMLSDAADQGRVRSTVISDVRRSLEKARQIGVRSQQIAKIAERGGRGRSERLKLDELVQEALTALGEPLRRSGLSVLRLLPATEVSADRSLVVSLLHGLLAWAMDHADRRLELHIERGELANEAHLVCAIQHRNERVRCSRFGGPAAWGANWHLLRHAAQALGWSMRSGDEGGMTWVRFSFACIDVRESPAIEVVELGTGQAQAGDGPRGGPVRVVASRVEARRAIYEAIEHLGVEVEFADAVSGQADAWGMRRPAAVVLERDTPPAVSGELRRRCASAGVPLIQIDADESTAEIGSPGSVPLARIGTRALGSALPIAVLLALTPSSHEQRPGAIGTPVSRHAPPAGVLHM